MLLSNKDRSHTLGGFLQHQGREGQLCPGKEAVLGDDAKSLLHDGVLGCGSGERDETGENRDECFQ
jgi:hypothetical protein